MKKFIGFVSVMLLMLGCSKQDVKLSVPSVIGQGMVLQRNSEVNIYGKASPGKKVKINTSWGEKKTIRSDKNGNWYTTVRTGEAGGPFELTIQSGDTSLAFGNILFGEVWLCSGQSNMEMPLTGWPPNDTINHSASEIASSANSMIRLFTVPKAALSQPADDCEGEWTECTPENIKGFSATAYFFGREIFNKLNVPVGLIHSSWGGTPAEAWTPAEYLKKIPAYSNIPDSLRSAFEQHNNLMSWLKNLPADKIDLNNPGFLEKIRSIDLNNASSELNDETWPGMPVPSLWENNVLPGFDGAVWMRYSFDLPKAMEGKELTLNLGPIDDMDMTFINGTKIGEIMKPGFWREGRNYRIPASYMKPGKNVLAVCVFDFQGGGGIYGKNDVTISGAKGESIILSGNWKYMPVAEVSGEYMYYFTSEINYSDRPKVTIPVNQNTPTALFNGMINPLIPYTIKGAIWYQGESNVGRGYEYRTLFPAMISSWRELWGGGDFPFYYVQIAPWGYSEAVPSPSAELREAQLLTMDLPATGMVVTTDIGNPVNIHPSNKQEVGRRLALWALAKDYGFDDLEYSGPLYDSISAEPGKIRVHFTHTAGGLIAKGGPLTWFEVAGADQVYYPAEAVIDGNTVLVSSSRVKEPVAVRFGWNSIAEPNLFNSAGLPASPFRSDNWKRLSE